MGRLSLSNIVIKNFEYFSLPQKRESVVSKKIPAFAHLVVASLNLNHSSGHQLRHSRESENLPTATYSSIVANLLSIV